MHYAFATRGIKQWVDRWISDLEAQYFTYGNNMQVQLSIRPIQFWEVIFPKEHINEVLRTLNYAKVEDPKRRTMLKLLRASLGYDRIPNVDLSKVNPRMTSNLGMPVIATYPIGIKEDKIFPDGQYKGFEQL